MNLRHLLQHAQPAALGRQLSAPHNRSRLHKLLLAVTDQLLFAGSNFVVSVVLARWMSYETYGAYTFAFSLFLLFAGFHNVLLLEPFTIIGSSQHRASLSAYSGRIVRLHTYWTVVVSAASLPVGAVLWVAGNDQLGGALLGLALAQGAILYFWYVRRKWYVVQRIGHAVIGTAVYAAGQLLATLVLREAGVLTPFSVFAAIGAVALVAASVVRGAHVQPDAVETTLPMRQVIEENWHYGKWLLLGGIFYWLTGQGYNILAGSILSLADTGALKALQNLINPITQLFIAFNLVFMPWMSRRHAELGSRVMMRDLMAYTAFSTASAAIYWVALILVREPLFDLLYGGAYREYVHLLPGMALLPVVTALTSSWTIGLRILRKTHLLFWVDSIGGIFTVSAGVVLVYRFGLPGAVAGSVISTASRLPVLIMLWRHATREVGPVHQTELS